MNILDWHTKLSEDPFAVALLNSGDYCWWTPSSQIAEEIGSYPILWTATVNGVQRNYVIHRVNQKGWRYVMSYITKFRNGIHSYGTSAYTPYASIRAALQFECSPEDRVTVLIHVAAMESLHRGKVDE